MKKITLLFLSFFAGALVTIYVLGFFLPGDKFFQPAPSVGTSTSTPSDTKNPPVITMEEVSKHSLANDCYLVINNKAYGVSGYLDQHPGGRKAIIEQCGQEASRVFSAIHSNFAWDLLKNYYIADVTPN